MKPFALKTYRIYAESLDRDVEITVFSSGNQTLKRPLILMQDGQNLFFDQFATYKTSWGLLNFIAREDFLDCILVGITCGDGSVRLDEYCPYVFDSRAQNATGYAREIGGKGDAYLDFIYYTLIPHIHLTFRCEDKVYIGGSSMGGVIACYAALTFPDQTAGIFGLSNAFWVASDSFVTRIEQFKGELPKIYLDLGDREHKEPLEMGYIRDCEERIEAALTLREPAKMRFEIIQNGVHNEASWRQRIEEILRWMLEK